jgi:hypothetical protein
VEPSCETPSAREIGPSAPAIKARSQNSGNGTNGEDVKRTSEAGLSRQKIFLKKKLHVQKKCNSLIVSKDRRLAFVPQVVVGLALKQRVRDKIGTNEPSYSLRNSPPTRRTHRKRVGVRVALRARPISLVGGHHAPVFPSVRCQKKGKVSRRREILRIEPTEATGVVFSSEILKDRSWERFEGYSQRQRQRRDVGPPVLNNLEICKIGKNFNGEICTQSCESRDPGATENVTSHKPRASSVKQRAQTEYRLMSHE